MMKLKALFFGCCHSDCSRVDEQGLVKDEFKRPSQENAANGGTNKTDANLNKASNNPSDDNRKLPWLTLKAIEGNIIPLDTEIEINPLGVTTGGRQKQDGITYIGCQKYIISGKNAEQQLFNDILLNDASVGDQHCQIKYDPTLKTYFLKDMGEGSGTFVKIDQEIPLKSGYIISFGDSHMVSTIKESKSGADIMLKFLDGQKTDEVYNFKADDKIIKLGRMTDCEIKFDGNNLSRYQLTIEYKQDKGWVIIDGYNGKPSTNGTWLYVEGFYEITDNMTVKIGQTLFKINITTKN